LPSEALRLEILAEADAATATEAAAQSPEKE